MRWNSTRTCSGLVAGPSACGLPAGSPAHRAGVILAEPASHEAPAARAPRRHLCRPAMRGTGGAGKTVVTVVTDYRITGPGCATRNPVGWGEPQTPLAPLVRAATA